MKKPYSADGSTLDETCRHEDGYFRIGPKEEQVKVKSLADALTHLKQEKTAYWRRPSPTSGVQSVVKAVKWA